MTEWLRLIRYTPAAIMACPLAREACFFRTSFPLARRTVLMSSPPSQICSVGPSTWTSSRRPARCLPQLICCQVTEMTPLAATRLEIQPSPDLSVSAAEMSGGGSALVPVRPGALRDAGGRVRHHVAAGRWSRGNGLPGLVL